MARVRVRDKEEELNEMGVDFESKDSLINK